jgi:hypothetical protein
MFPPGSMPSFSLIYSLSWRLWEARRGAAQEGEETGGHRPRSSPLPPSFWGRFFESGHDTHVFTLTHVPVAPAA